MRRSLRHPLRPQVSRPDRLRHRWQLFLEWAALIGQVSQLGLLVVAIVVYVYTVVPIYQKSVLDEDIAKKTLELSTVTSELRKTREEMAQLEPRIIEAQKSLAEVTGKLSKAEMAIVSEKQRAQAMYREVRLQIVWRIVQALTAECARPLQYARESTPLASLPAQPTTFTNVNSFATCAKPIISRPEVASNLNKLAIDDKQLLDHLLSKSFEKSAAEQPKLLTRLTRAVEAAKEKYQVLQAEHFRSLLDSAPTLVAKNGSFLVNAESPFIELLGIFNESDGIAREYATMVQQLCANILDEFVKSGKTG